MHNSNDQFGLRELLLALTAFAITSALFHAAFSRQSIFFLFCSALMFGASCGGSFGFIVGGRVAVPIGALIGGAIMLVLYVVSIPNI